MVRHIRTTIITGVLTFLPVFVIAVVGFQTFTASRRVLGPVVEALDLHSSLGAFLLFVVSILAVLVVVYVLGLIARFGFIAHWLHRMEHSIGHRVPIYGFVKSIVTGAIDETETDGFSPVQVKAGLGERIGFIVDRQDDGRLVVFLPNAPNPRSGQVFVVEPETCTPLNVPAHKVFEILTAFGRGGAALKKMPAPSPDSDGTV